MKDINEKPENVEYSVINLPGERSVTWKPTMTLRWKRKKIEFDPINSRLVLQQMWESDSGEQDFRDIEEGL